jgi:hypothetical protein
MSPKLPFEGRIMFPGLWIGNPGVRFPLQGGYNLYVVDEHTGEVIERAVFKTNIRTEASEQMAAFLTSIPHGRIVIALTWDDASRELTDPAVEALGTIGAASDLRDFTTSCHAVVGVKGAGAGEALERLDSFTARLGLGQFNQAGKVGLWFERIVLHKKASD